MIMEHEQQGLCQKIQGLLKSKLILFMVAISYFNIRPFNTLFTSNTIGFGVNGGSSDNENLIAMIE